MQKMERVTGKYSFMMALVIINNINNINKLLSSKTKVGKVYIQYTFQVSIPSFSL